MSVHSQSDAAITAMTAASADWVAQTRRRLRAFVDRPQDLQSHLERDDLDCHSAAAQDRYQLRLWWGSGPTVVVGNSEKLLEVVDEEACQRYGVKVLRRRSAGGTVLQTADVLNYSLTAPNARLLDVNAVFRLGADFLVAALGRLGLRGELRGASDVAIGERKISGNAQLRRAGGVLLHGTLLLAVDLDLMESCLRHPPREPAYREGRRHRDFLTSLRTEGINLSPAQLEQELLAAVVDLRQ